MSDLLRQRVEELELEKEHRRYEIAKAVMAGFATWDNVSECITIQNHAKTAIEWADALLEELEK